MHPVLEYDPPLPKSPFEMKYSSPGLYFVTGDARFQTDVPWTRGPFEPPEETEERFRTIDAYFQEPICRKCGNATSPRSKKKWNLPYGEGRYDGVFGGGAGAWCELISTRFLHLLTNEERARLELQPVEGKRNAKKFFEIVGPPGPPFIAVAGLDTKGWRCTACSYRTPFGYTFDDTGLSQFVARGDLPSPLPDIFTVGQPPTIHLVATAKRWQELVGKKGARGFCSRLLGVAPDEEVIRHMELPTYEDFMREQGRERFI
ncbi:MAG: hypothetical protein U0793_11465 [Gemmataceae bacterium]